MIPDPRSGVLNITHRQEGDTVVYTASMQMSREMAWELVNGKKVWVSYPIGRPRPPEQ